jgi:predicted solute-binding protein
VADARTIRILARQALRWSTAAIQDREPVVAVLHANYASSYAQALRQIASDREIQKVTGLDAQVLEMRIARVQDRATEALFKRCPKLRPRLPIHISGRLREGLIGIEEVRAP